MKGNRREVEEFFSYLINMEKMSLSQIVLIDPIKKLSPGVYSRAVSVKIGSGIAVATASLRK
jgi:hypothetical protein